MKSMTCFIGLVTTRRQMTGLSSMLKASTVRKLKWNGITFKKGRQLWRVYDQVIMIGLYSYELAYLINNSAKQAIILEMEDRGFATKWRAESRESHLHYCQG